MLEFKTERLTDRVTRIHAFSSELMYLVEGDNRAALLDTGTGIGSLKKCVEKLTDKPIIVLLTHGHIDHAMGAPEFDEVYMNRRDDYIYKKHSPVAFRMAGIHMSPLCDLITKEDIIPEKSCDTFHDMKGGDTFELGGVTIEIYDCPGHTRGSVVMLIKEERAVLLGDACNTFTFMFDDYSTSISEYEKNLIKLNKDLEGKFDTVYLSHGDGSGTKDIIEEVLEVCEDIKKGNTDDMPFEFHGKGAWIAKAVSPDSGRIDGKKGNIVYSKEKIW